MGCEEPLEKGQASFRNTFKNNTFECLYFLYSDGFYMWEKILSCLFSSYTDVHLLVHLNLFIYLRDKETRILLLAYVVFSMHQLLRNCLHAPRRMSFGLSSFPLLSKQDSSRSNLGVEQTLGSLGLSSK